MMPGPLQISPDQRAMLSAFERLHAQWRQASDAADAMECMACSDGWPGERLLQQRLAADRLHREAMQLLRDAPL